MSTVYFINEEDKRLIGSNEGTSLEFLPRTGETVILKADKEYEEYCVLDVKTVVLPEEAVYVILVKKIFPKQQHFYAYQFMKEPDGDKEKNLTPEPEPKRMAAIAS